MLRNSKKEDIKTFLVCLLIVIVAIGMVCLLSPKRAEAQGVFVSTSEKAKIEAVIKRYNHTATGDWTFTGTVTGAGGTYTFGLPLKLTGSAVSLGGLSAYGSAYQRLAMNATGNAVEWIYPSYLSATDGTPQKAIQTDATGHIGIGTVPGADTEVTIVQDLSDGFGLKVARNIDEAGSNPLAQFGNNHVNNTQATIKVVHASTSGANGFGILVDSENLDTNALYAKGKFPAHFLQDLSDGYGLKVQRNLDEAGSNALVILKNDHAADTKATISVQNDGSGPHFTTGAASEDMRFATNGAGRINIADGTGVFAGSNGDEENWLNTEIYCDSTVTAETTISNVLPAGYIIENIIFKNTTANLVTNFDIGFSDAGGEIAAAGNILASDEGSFTVNQRIDDFDSADTIYLSADNWNGANLIVYIKMSKMF